MTAGMPPGYPQIPNDGLNGRPVGHQGTRVDIAERKAWSLGVGGAMAVILLILAFFLIAFVSFIGGIGVAARSGSGPLGGLAVVFSIVFGALGLLLMTGFSVISPGETRVVQFFGRYVGTIRRTGIVYTVPFSRRLPLSVRVRNFETHELKVNDYDGNPINIASIVVWQVADTAKATFAVENYNAFVATQAESALRHVAMSHPYDRPDDDSAETLRGATDVISAEIATEVAERVALAGVEIIEARISSLAYASEIAQAMLQRQQAGAIIAARQQIVTGAVSMVEDALERLEGNDALSLDDDRKAAMVSNLLVVLCGDSRVTPMVNTGAM